jgi:uncharacterized Zn-finger protein
MTSEQAGSADSAARNAQSIDVTEKDLPLHCPMTRTPVWNYHPRVFLQFGEFSGSTPASVRCPYCGTVYTFKGAAPPSH